MRKFDTVFHGYDKNQVHKCIDDIINNYEVLLNKSKKTEEQNRLLREKIQYYERIEDSMNRAIFTAETAGDQIKSSARKEADALITEARHNASRIINDALLKAEKAEHGIIHCFTEDYETAKKALDLGFYISLSGIVTFKNATELQAVAKKLPKDRILIETDSPYLAPVPKRGKSNEPAFVPYVADFLAKHYDMPVDEFAHLTHQNFDALLHQYT